MASSRASSPVEDVAPASPVQLTPNSKVRAMLAALDGDSDKESSAVLKQSIFTKRKSPKASALTSPVQQPNSSDEEVSEEDDVVRPRGRVAARMLQTERSSLQETTTNTETATDRVRKLFANRGNVPPAETDAGPASQSSEEDVTASTRKLKKRRARETTPQYSPVRKSAGSPGLFVSPARSSRHASVGVDSDNDLPAHPAAHINIHQLAARKRREQEAKQAEELKRKLERSKKDARHNRMVEEDEASDLAISDDEEGKRLTQSMRPTRKAGKKALEEMARETQRMARGMQLTHAATTKKKYTLSSFLSKHGVKRDGSSESDDGGAKDAGAASSVNNSDALTKETPPTSPIQEMQKPDVEVVNADLGKAVTNLVDQDGELPTLEEALNTQIPSSPPVRLAVDKGKARAIDEKSEWKQNSTPKKTKASRRFITRAMPVMSLLDGSDDDLEIVDHISPVKKTKQQLKNEALFALAPKNKSNDPNSFHRLRLLAHLTSPGEKTARGRNAKPSMNPVEFQISLQQRARQQALKEREERLQELRDRGVFVQTAEERQKELEEVEDLMARARREGEEIKQKEKEEAKRERKANGEVDPLGDSSDDEDWDGEGENSEGEASLSGSDADIELSGSEDEDDGEANKKEDEEMAEDVEDKSMANGLIDDQASETESEKEQAEDVDMETEDPFFDDEEPTAPVIRRRNKAAVISDDEDEEVVKQSDNALYTPAITVKTPVQPSSISPASRAIGSPAAPGSVLRSATKTFIPGLPVAGPAGLDLTQIFQGTMDDNVTQTTQDSPMQSRPDTQQLDPRQDGMSFLRNAAPPMMPTFEPTNNDDSQDFVPNSQGPVAQELDTQATESETQGIQLNFSQSQFHNFDSMVLPTQQYSQIEATQDAGPQDMTPLRARFEDPPQSTVDTVLVEQDFTPNAYEETPVMKKRGRLQRRTAIAEFSDEEDQAEAEDGFEISANAFDVLRKASKQKPAVPDFDKKKSHAKDMVQEQADESEDEYAGLGGASDDDSVDEEDALVQEIIDDEDGKEADERQLAALYAENDRQRDEKEVERLLRDITNGNLRKKRGADYDLEDSDDDGEARRRMKQREFAKMRKALLADERVGKIAENPKNLAFLKAIEDRGSDDEMDFLDDIYDTQTEDYSQTENGSNQTKEGQEVVPNSQPDTSMAPPSKHNLNDSSSAANRLPPHLRRTQNVKKPSSLSEVRKQLSSLIDEPDSFVTTAPSDSESDLEGEDTLQNEDIDDLSYGSQKEKENRDPFASRRTVAIVDRISLKRQASSNVSTSSRMAFTTAASSGSIGFKVPALLRRATTNSSVTSTGTGVSATERAAGSVGGAEEQFKKKASKTSGIHFAARESERRSKVKEVERKRDAKKFKVAVQRQQTVLVGGLFGNGSFS